MKTNVHEIGCSLGFMVGANCGCMSLGTRATCIYIYIYVYIILFYVHFYSAKLNGTTEIQERFSSRTEHLPEKNCLGMCTLFEIYTIYCDLIRNIPNYCVH